MGPGEPAIRPSRETWIGCLIRLLASHGDQCDPSLYLFLRWLALLLFRSILSQMMPSATDGNASFLRAARAGNLEKVLDYLKGSIDINTSNANGLNALHLAAKEGHVNVVSELLKRGANVNATTKKGNSALHIASLAGQEEVVKLLVQKQANVNVQSQNGFTPLYMAAQENHDGVVRFLLANGANQSLATEDGFTPLAVALQQGHDKVVAVLLENDARGKVRLPALHIASKKDDCKAAALLLHSEHNPDVTSKSGFTPLHIAAHYGNSNIASLLLEKGADVNFPAKHQITPLHVAAKWGKSNMVKLLLEKGAKIDASTRDGLTPLHCAARSGHDQVVEQLLEKNAPITAKTKNGLAPLHMASQGDHVDSARILLYHKAPVDDVTVDYLTALHVAAHCGHVGVAKLLLDRRADPNARALNGFTPLHIACKKNRIKVVELLLKHGASIEATTESGLTPLHVASFMGCMNIVIYLIQHGANPDIPTVRGETPLHLAARANQTDIIRILLRNGAHVDAKARELQTALHIASRLGNADMVGLLLQHGAAVDAPTKDAYTPLHVAAREGQDEVAALLLDHGAALAAPTKKGFTPLHLAAKYGNLKVAQLLLQKDAPVDAQGKNGVTPLHVAAHYDHVNVALLLLEKGASPHSAARNGYTPLHVAARKDQMDIASSLLEYGAKPGAESRAGFTPLHLAAQEGHADLAALLVEHGADCDAKAKNGLTPMHLCAQEDRVEVATILAKHGASLDPTTKAGYTPLHVACHFGQTNMIRFLLRQGANVNATTSHGYTPLHQAAQQGHTLIINLLLEHRAAPNAITNQGQTALAIAQRLGYISVVETLKVVTETIVTTTTTTVTEEKYRVVAPETMHETFMSDSEDEAAEDNMLGDQSFRYLTADEMKSLGDDSLPIDVTRDERITESIHITREPGLSAPLTQEEERLSPTQAHTTEAVFVGNYAPDNVDLSRTPIHAGSLLSWDGDSCSSAYVLSPTKRMWRESSKLKWKTFLVSFLVDARGGAMRGCRHSGVRVIIPPRKAQMPMRITCRYLRKEKLPHPPPLLEGEACASRILEVGPAGAKFLGPVILEVPHFASLRGKEREISILRSDNGETWKEHTLEASEEAVQEVLNESFEGEELSALEDLQTNRIVRILTTDFPQYFAVVSRTRQEVHAVGPEGGLLSSTVVPQVQAIFPEGALTKKIRVGLQAQPIPADLVTKLLGHRVAVSPIVTVEPRRRKFHKPITLTIPVPQAATKGMINQYAGDAPTLRLLCSITGGTNKAQWEDVTGSTPLTFVNDCVSFTTTVSARFWLMDCRQVSEATKFATELYAEAMHVPFMAKFVVFAKRLDPMEAQLRVFCMTDDKEDKTLESQEHFTEVAKSRDVEVLEKKSQYLEFGGNLVPVTKSGEQLQLQFQAFRENRLPFSVRVKDPHQEPLGRLAFMRQPRAARATEPPQAPLCNLNIALPEYEASQNLSELVTLEKKYGFVEETGLAKPELIHRADLRLSDIARELGSDWPALAAQLDVPEQDVASIRTECPSDLAQQALLMLRLWMKRAGGRATGNNLEKGLRMINREDIVNKCMFNVELVTDDVEKAVAKVHLDQSGFDTFREELGTPKDTSLKRDASLDVSYDEQDLMKAESAEETSSETGSVHEKHTGSEAKAVDASDQVEEPVVEKLELARRESKRYSQEFEQDEPLPKAMGFKTKPSEETVVSSTQVKGIHDNGTVKHTVTTVTKTTIIQEVEEPAGAHRPGESETWASDLDTSQVSVSSLPEDERTEPTLSSSTTTATADAEALSGPLARTQVEEKEWTETDPDSGEVRHIISKTTHTTVTSMKPGEGAPRGDTMSTSISHSSKGSHGGSAASAPSRHDEAESLTFFQKKEFFEKLSEQSPLQETLSTRLGSTPSLDTALTRPVVTVKPRPRSESLTSQGEIVEENIVFAERLRLFQNGAQAGSLPGASLPHLDLMDPRRQSREQKLQDMPEMVDSLQQQSSEVLEGLQGTDGKSDTRLLVHTSDADKEAFDVRTVQSPVDIGDQQFSRMRVRMPASEECVSETLISSCDLPGEKPSPLRDAYKDSLLAPQQEGSQTGGDHLMEAESALDDSSRPVTATRVITTRTTRTVGPDGREQLVTTTTEEGAGGDDPELRMRRSMQGVLDNFMADPSAPPPHSDEEE
ncbi:ankyrin-3 isoform X45 [Dermacentor silvarum]|uniref:ankyrin-3 isoform X45 n=1 Tax=Dermacentor silvarum TaxID=543639 RepID=UPI002100D635|nr:ankyrin-3 isoform X45 [Dermacentor silvarum]